MANLDRRVGKVLRRCLEEGAVVEIDGLGVFFPQPDGQFGFRPDDSPKLFLAYVEEDVAKVRRLYEDLRAAGCNPWWDKEKLLPGQNWPRAIRRAIQKTDFFLPCFSKRATEKRGAFQAELHYALDSLIRCPPDTVFIMPVRFEECRLPDILRDEIQYVDLFRDWDQGVSRLLASIDEQRRKEHRPPRRRRDNGERLLPPSSFRPKIPVSG